MATKKKKARARRPSLPRTYDYTLGADIVPSSGARVVGLSTTGKVTLGILAAGALAWLFWPKKAAAAETPADKAIPTNVDAPAAAGSTTVTKDPGSGVAIVGNTGKLATSQSYTIRAGDAGWSNLASRTYGDYRWWPALWDANRSGTKFQNPDILRIGDGIVIPSLPVNDAKFKAAVFARAEADRAWQLARAKARAAKKAFTTPRPSIISAATPVSTALLPASAGGPTPIDQGITPSATTTTSPNINASSGVTASTANPTTPTTAESMEALEADMASLLQNR